MDEEMYKRLFQAIYDAIVVADATGNIIIFNNAAEKLFGYSVNDVIGKNVTILMPEEYRNIHKEGLQRFIRTGVPRIIGKLIEVEGLTREGRRFPIELTVSFIKDEDQYIFIAIIRDITARKQTEIELNKRLKELEKFHKLSVDREIRMAGLKEELAALKERLKEK